MWYIMDSDENANIVLGLKEINTNPVQFKTINSNNIDVVYNREQVKKGDCYFIPAGKIHAIGAGALAVVIHRLQ